MSTIEKYVEEILSPARPNVYIRLTLCKKPRVVRKKMFDDIVKTLDTLGVKSVTDDRKYHIRVFREGIDDVGKRS